MKRIINSLSLIATCLISQFIFAQDFTGTQTVNSGQNMTLTVDIDATLNEVTLTLEGPNNVWYGYGFGGSAMSGTYVIITDGSGNIVERNLGFHNTGTLLTTSLTSSSSTVNGSVRTTTVTRPLAGTNGNYYTFASSTGSIPIIWSYGSGSSLSKHVNKGATSITMSKDCTNKNTSNTIDVSACNFYLAPSKSTFWKVSGTYTDVIPNSVGCDSVLTINLTMNENDTSIYEEVCNNYLSASGNYLWDSTGTYVDTVTNSHGCDSIITIDLVVFSTDTLLTEESCNQVISPSGKYTWATTGIYNDTLPNSVGCDSVITVDLTINTHVDISFSKIACGSYTSPSGNHIWESTGTYFDTIISATDCDTAFTIDLVIANLNLAVTKTGSALFADFTQADGYQWLDCDNAYLEIDGATNINYLATKTGTYAVEITFGDCIDTSACFAVDRSANINELLGQDEIKFYPNPTNGILNINLPQSESNLAIRIVNVDGQLVSELRVNNKANVELYIHGDKGLYFVELLYNDGLKEVFKVIKQ